VLGHGQAGPLTDLMTAPLAAAGIKVLRDGRTVPNSELPDVQLGFYQEHPDVVTRTLFRTADRMQKLDLPR
jgi:hypothetical protein